MELAGFPNLGRAVGSVVAARYATLHELQTVYGLNDLYNLLEVMAVDAYNRDLINRRGE